MDPLSKYEEVYKEELGELKGHKTKIHVDREAQPRFCKACSIPYSMRTKVEGELSLFQKQGIIILVQLTNWAALIVPVLKADRETVRICREFKMHMTTNEASQLDKYPMESLLGNIPGVVIYSDDILITGKADEKHLAMLQEVLTRLKDASL